MSGFWAQGYEVEGTVLRGQHAHIGFHGFYTTGLPVLGLSLRFSMQGLVSFAAASKAPVGILVFHTAGLPEGLRFMVSGCSHTELGFGVWGAGFNVACRCQHHANWAPEAPYNRFA